MLWASYATMEEPRSWCALLNLRGVNKRGRVDDNAGIQPYRLLMPTSNDDNSLGMQNFQQPQPCPLLVLNGGRSFYSRMPLVRYITATVKPAARTHRPKAAA
ncbi:hypothetical protein ABAC402_16370 [Asticcacaulis sp. AC402]|nr:hypothetical protein ABAC402_16370 [Asticcacaulis sp. AC402]